MVQEATVDTIRSLLSGLVYPRIVVSGNMATPEIAISLVDESCEVATINILNAVRELPDRAGITLETAFVGPAMRGKANLRYLPCRLSMVPILFRHDVRPDVVIVHTSQPSDGCVSLGVEVNVLPAAIAAAKAGGGVVIAMVNPNMPHTLGDAEVPLSDIDFVVEIDEPVLAHPTGPPDECAAEIGSLIASHIHDGRTLQLGIGAIPDAVLREVDARDLRIWTETFSDGVLDLFRRGCFDDSTPLAVSFLIGSDELYQWAHRNERVHMVRTEICNNPGRIAQNYGMTSINAALQVDLFGQANASRLGRRIYSGFGGSTDFIVGAIHAEKGHSFMALPSWHPKANVSTIVGQLDVPATSFQQNAVVTEQGVAWLFGADQNQQAQNLITNAAHPDARDGLKEFWQSR